MSNHFSMLCEFDGFVDWTLFVVLFVNTKNKIWKQKQKFSELHLLNRDPKEPIKVFYNLFSVCIYLCQAFKRVHRLTPLCYILWFLFLICFSHWNFDFDCIIIAVIEYMDCLDRIINWRPQINIVFHIVSFRLLMNDVYAKPISYEFAVYYLS